MKYILVVRPKAERDLEKAFEWYEDQTEGLGRDFLLEARKSIKKLTERPLSFPVSFGRTRRVLLDRFPYSIFYSIIGDEVTVTACIHQSRHPRVWMSRR